MPVFNSLGSNYDHSALRAVLHNTRGQAASRELTKYFDERYGGKTVLLHKGREAIELALKLLELPKGSMVAINGFTCYAVYKAIIDQGLEVAYVDIAPGALHFTVKELDKMVMLYPHIKVVMLQNTLGFPADGIAIAEYCRQHKLFLIEDLAHSIGTTYDQNIEAGTIGDFTILSMSQDKVVDAVAGGALIIRNQKYKEVAIPARSTLPLFPRIQYRLYPVLTWLIRSTYHLAIGKALHVIFKKANLLSGPMNYIIEKNHFHKMPEWQADWILRQYQKLEKRLAAAQNIAKIYAENLPAVFQFQESKNIELGSCLRFPILVINREQVINELKTQGIYLSDIWYDAPIGPKKFLTQTNYFHQCPESDKVVDLILNLPTHRKVTPKLAQKIAKCITTHGKAWST